MLYFQPGLLPETEVPHHFTFHRQQCNIELYAFVRRAFLLLVITRLVLSVRMSSNAIFSVNLMAFIVFGMNAFVWCNEHSLTQTKNSWVRVNRSFPCHRICAAYMRWPLRRPIHWLLVTITIFFHESGFYIFLVALSKRSTPSIRLIYARDVNILTGALVRLASDSTR